MSEVEANDISIEHTRWLASLIMYMRYCNNIVYCSTDIVNQLMIFQQMHIHLSVAILFIDL